MFVFFLQNYFLPLLLFSCSGKKLLIHTTTYSFSVGLEVVKLLQSHERKCDKVRRPLSSSWPERKAAWVREVNAKMLCDQTLNLFEDPAYLMKVWMSIQRKQRNKTAPLALCISKLSKIGARRADGRNLWLKGWVWELIIRFWTC